MTLTGKAIVITGAGHGIGKATALMAARLGASVIVNDIDGDAARSVAERICAQGGDAARDAADISSWKGAGSTIAHCVNRYGRVDGLVNNAAVLLPIELEEADEQTWRRTIEVNLLGAAFCLTHATHAMLAAGSGAIVNIISGAHQGAPNVAPYGASKGALASLTYCAAIDLADKPIRVNAVSPVAATRMAEVATRYATSRGRPGMGDPPAPEANAPVICFLLSDAARDFRGQIIRVEPDGLSMLGHPTALNPYPRIVTQDYEAVSDALTSTLSEMLQPLGIKRGRLTFETDARSLDGEA
jgi:NAD(P)-dependent dehydrogenase (short-subunit alcohol dehydrogenase family)